MAKKNRRKESKIEQEIWLLKEALSRGLTLERCAAERGIDCSELEANIASHSSIGRAYMDGRKAGQAFWQNELIRLMTGKDVNQQLVKLYMANYMQWYDKPIQSELKENATVIINVNIRKPTKKEKQGMNK